jgi:hypothetical protein
VGRKADLDFWRTEKSIVSLEAFAAMEFIEFFSGRQPHQNVKVF